MLPHHVAVSSHAVRRVAATGLTASVLTIVPVVRGTLIAVMACHVLPAWAGSGLPVAVTLAVAASGADGSGSHAGTA